MNTVFYKTTEGNIKTVTDSLTQKELIEEMRSNGFAVVGCYKGSYTVNDLERLEKEKLERSVLK